MGNMEEQNLDLLNIEQEDDNLLGISTANAALSLGVSPLSPSVMPKAMKRASMENLENCYGKDDVVGASAVVGADLDVNMAPVLCRSPMVPSSVLSVLNFNEMNKRNVNRDVMEEPYWSRRGYGMKESIQLDGIAETSPVKNPGTFTSQLSRSYLDIENEQAGVTIEKGGGEPTVLRKSRTRRSTTLRKSLAWDKAFFTDEGVLDNDELFAVTSDAPKTLTMPELATIWDGPQPVIAAFEAKTTPAKNLFKSEFRLDVRTEAKPEVKTQVKTEVKTEVRSEVKPAVNLKSQQDVSHTSLRPVRQIHTSGSHAFSTAFSRAAAIPPGSTSIPLPNSLSRTGKQPGAAGRHLTELSQGTGPDQTREPRNTSTGLHHQARIAALKKAHEAPLQKGPRVRLPNSTSNKKLEDKHLEEIQKVKQPKKVEDKHLEDVHKLKQPKKVEAKPSEDIHQIHVTPKKQTQLTRSMSTSALLDSPSALSRKVSFMSKKVKETLGKVMAGRALRVPKEPLLSHVHPVEKAPMLSKRSGALPTVLEVKDPSHRTRPSSAVVPIKVNKETYTVRDILRGKGPPSSPREASKQGPSLMRSKSACAVPGLPRATEPELARVIAPSIPPLPVQPVEPLPSEPVGKPTGLRKPSPKLGFFDAGRATCAPHKASAISQLFQGMQPARPASEASLPIDPLGHRSHALAPVRISSAIPSAPHLRHGAVSAPTSPRSAYMMHPSSPKSNSIAATMRPSSPRIGGADLPMSFTGLRHANQFAESHQLQAKKMLPGDINGNTGTATEASAFDAFELPEALSSSRELNMEPTEVTKATGLRGDSPRCRSFREIYSKAVYSCADTGRDNELPLSACPSTPTSRDHSHAVSAKISRQFDSPRSKSFRETSFRTSTPADSPALAASKHARSYSQRVPWVSPGGKVIGTSSPGVCPATPASGGRRHSTISPSYAPDAAGTFEVLTPSSLKTARCVGTPGSSAKKVVRKIVEFESPSSQWSNWPVLGAAISADQFPGSAKKDEVLSSVPPKPPSREQATEPSTESRPNDSASLLRSPSLKAKHPELDNVSGEQCASATERSPHSRSSFFTGFLSTSSNDMCAEMDSESMDRDPLLGSNGAEVCPSTPASTKNEKGSSLLSFARKAVARLTSPGPADPLGQDNEGTPRSSRKTSRRFSRSGSSSNCPAPEPKPLSPFSEARICELEAAGPEILEKKSGPVQNSPPDKVVPEANPWSPVRKNGHSLGPFDCTKLKYISPGLPTS